LIGTLREIIQKEGATALYRGILSPLAVEPFKRAVKFSANAKYNALIVGNGQKTVLTATLCGALAGMSEVRPVRFLRMLSAWISTYQQVLLYAILVC